MLVLLSVIRVIHVFSAVIWAGVAFVNYAWLGPAVKASGPAGGTVMAPRMDLREKEHGGAHR